MTPFTLASMSDERHLRTDAQQRGDAAERLVAERLTAAGWRILGRNVHVGRSEIDLLAVDPGPPVTFVLLEVRWRRERSFGLPEETLDWRKRRHLRTALARLMGLDRLPDGTRIPALPVRIDLVALEPPDVAGGEVRLRHHRAAVGR